MPGHPTTRASYLPYSARSSHLATQNSPELLLPSIAGIALIAGIGAFAGEARVTVNAMVATFAGIRGISSFAAFAIDISVDTFAGIARQIGG
jgi:hypothetical protein